MADDPPFGSDTIEVPMVFVPRDDPEPEDWKARHPGWVKFPAVMVPRASGPPVPGSPAARNASEAAAREPTTTAAPPATLGSSRRLIPLIPPADPGGLRERAGDDPIAAYVRVNDALWRDGIVPVRLASDAQASPVDGAAPAPLGPSRPPRPSPPPDPARKKHQTGRSRVVRPRPHPLTKAQQDEIDAALKLPRVQAFLRLIQYEETRTEGESGYRIRYGGRDVMSDDELLHYYPVNESHDGLSHTPAGAFQITEQSWDDARDSNVAHDFLPQSQRRIAARMIIQHAGALAAISDGHLDLAFLLLRKTWSSLPGGTGQTENAKAASERYGRYLAATQAGQK